VAASKMLYIESYPNVQIEFRELSMLPIYFWERSGNNAFSWKALKNWKPREKKKKK
jgi:hypothetical protein